MIRTRIIERVNMPQEIVIPGGIPGTATVRLDFQELPSAGTVTFERRVSYQGDWLPIKNGANLSVTSDPVEVKFDGGVNLLRVTLTGLTGGLFPVLTIVENETATPPSFLLTDGGFGNSARLRVDNGATGFFDRRTWELPYEFTTLAEIPVVFRFIIPCNFLVTHSTLSVDQGGVNWRTYAESQGVSSGNFATEFPLQSANTMNEQPVYDFLSSVAYGGSFIPTDTQAAITKLRVRSAGATAQQSSVGSTVVQEKGRAAGIYYGVLERMEGVNGDCKGVLNIVVEERPQ